MSAKKDYPGSLQRRGRSRYKWTYYLGNDQRKSEEFRTGSKREAIRLARQRFQEYQTTGVVQPRGAMIPRGHQCMSELFDAWRATKGPVLRASTLRLYDEQLDRFREFFGETLRNPRVCEIRPDHISQFLTHRRNGGPLKTRTLNKDVVTLHGIFAWAEEMEWRVGNPVKRLFRAKETDARRGKALKPEQAAALLATCADQPLLHAAVATALYTGLRAGELFHLRFEDVDFGARLIRVVSGNRSDGFLTKNGESRITPIEPALRTILLQHCERTRMDGTGSAYVFHHTIKKAHYAPGDRLKSLLRSFRLAQTKAKLSESFRWHDLRHTRNTWWRLAERPDWAIARAMGHKAGPAMTEHYTDVKDEDVVRALLGAPGRSLAGTAPTAPKVARSGRRGIAKVVATQ